MQSITIIGGGLAGLSLGCALRRHEVPVVVKEAGDYPRHRVCGEFISGLHPATLTTLGLEGCLSDAAILQDVAWYDSRRQLRTDRLPVVARGLSRWALDQRIADQFQRSGGVLETGTRLNRQAMAPGWVDCAGRRPAQSSPWLGLKCHVRNFRQGADLEMHMNPQGYVGISRIENDGLNLCGLLRKAGLKPDPQQPLIFDYLQHCGFGALLERIDRTSVVAGSACSVAGMSYQRGDVPDGHTHLGDAQGLIPPFTGNGMTMAFEHAALAVEPLLQYARAELTWPECQRQIARQSRREFGRRLRVARGLHHLLTSEKLFKLTVGLASSPLFPFQSFYHLTR